MGLVPRNSSFFRPVKLMKWEGIAPWPTTFLHYYFYVLDPVMAPMSLCVDPGAPRCGPAGHGAVPRYGWTMRWTMRVVLMFAVLVAAVLVIGCENPSTDPDPDPDPDPTCDYQNDGECDEPYLCPVGTDTTDCTADPPDTSPTFGARTVPDQTYKVGTSITRLTLPVASSGNAPLRYSLTPGVPGLSFSAGSRTLYGTPTTAGNYSMTYRVVDSDGDFATLTFALVVAEPTGSVVFWTDASRGWSRIDVEVGGVRRGSLTTYLDSSPEDCSSQARGRVVVTLPPGKYQYRAVSDTGTEWTDTIEVTTGRCLRYRLSCPNGDCSGGGTGPPPNSNGSVVFWTRTDHGGGPISIYLGGSYIGRITQTLSRPPSDCETRDGARVVATRSPGNYSLRAEDTGGGSWSGTVTITRGALPAF